MLDRLPAATSLLIALQPLGPVPPGTVAWARQTLVRHFGASVVVRAARPLPRSAYYPPRQRYRAEKLLADLERNTPRTFDKVVGLTERDISTTKDGHADWGIFGYGAVGGRPAVLSSYRLRRGVSAARFRHRYANVLTHEFGHTLGLNHCPTRGCVMADYRGSVAGVDAQTGAFCASCKKHVAAAVAAAVRP